MAHEEKAIGHYAILVGIDAYNKEPLSSCVNDVQGFRQYLEALPFRVHVELFTASKSTEPGKFVPTEDPSRWPTRQNIVQALKNVASAKTGDFVYIHFSGHGAVADDPTRDLALVVLENEGRSQYLFGSEIAALLNSIVSKGILVTLVLDCCFSASVCRKHDEVRFLPYDSRFDSRPVQKRRAMTDATSRTSRDVTMLPDWLKYPDGFAVLCACRPHEVATGASFDGKKYGALSCFLLESLKEVGPASRHKDIYRTLCAKFQQHQSMQSPVLYGDSNQGFFDQAQSTFVRATAAVVKRQGSLHLQAGLAHGVNKGDKFVLYRWSPDQPGLNAQERCVTAEVSYARAFTSELERVDQASIRVRTGWVARAISCSALKQFPIRLDSDLRYRDDWLRALEKRSLNSAEHPISYTIRSKDNLHIEVVDDSDQQIPYLPPISDVQVSTERICNLMEHLVKYKLVRTLSNPTPNNSFNECFDAYVLSGQEKVRPETLMELKHGDKVKLVVENKGTQPLYLSIYALSSFWKIHAFHASYKVILPPFPGREPGRTVTPFTVKVPAQLSEKGHSQCEDVIKLFITSRPTSFDLFELPKIDEKIVEPPKIDEKDGISIVAPEDYRNNDENLPEDWAALNFPIRTSMPQI